MGAYPRRLRESILSNRYRSIPLSAQMAWVGRCAIIIFMRRFGMIIHLRPEAEAAYRQHHLAVWPAVLHTITVCNIRNYTIFLRDGCLFGYFEYVGQDYAADMRKMAADPATQRWWSIMEPMQEPLANRAPGEWWAAMEEVFHHE